MLVDAGAFSFRFFDMSRLMASDVVKAKTVLRCGRNEAFDPSSWLQLTNSIPIVFKRLLIQTVMTCESRY